MPRNSLSNPLDNDLADPLHDDRVALSRRAKRHAASLFPALLAMAICIGMVIGLAVVAEIWFFQAVTACGGLGQCFATRFLTSAAGALPLLMVVVILLLLPTLFGRRR